MIKVDNSKTNNGGSGAQPVSPPTGQVPSGQQTDYIGAMNPNSLPPVSIPPTPNNEPYQPPAKKFPLPKLKFLLFALFVVLILTGAGGGYLYFVKQSTTMYTLLPADSQFYLSLSVKKHPQVQKMLELGKRFPGGDKMINYLDDNRAELFGQRKDPFKEILDLVDTEIFLAKISSDEPEGDAWGGNPLEKLVNIVNFKGEKEAVGALIKLSEDENIITTKESYGSANISKLELVEQDKDETSKQYNIGALPYMVTLPLSKSIYATTIDNFMVSAEKDSDVKKILDLVGKKKEKSLKTLADDEGHREVVSHFPEETLVKFYQKQVLDPFSGAGLTSLPTTVFGGSQYDTTERDAEGDNVFDVKRGFTIVASDQGFDLSSYQLTEKSKIVEGLQHGFTINGSLASRLPALYNKNSILGWAELKDLKGILKDQEDKFWDIAQNSSDKDQKEIYAETLDDYSEAKKSFKEEFGLDVEEDILSWMTKQSAFIATTGAKDRAPETLAVFEVDDSKAVLGKLSKFKIKDYVKADETRRKSSSVKNDIAKIRNALQYGYSYSKEKQDKSFPATLNELTTRENSYMKTLPKQQSGQDYGYLTCANATEAIVWGLDETNGKYWAWVSASEKSGYMDVVPPPPGCNVGVSYDYSSSSQTADYPLIDPKIEDYKGEKIYSYPIIDYKGDVFTFRFASAVDLVVFSFGNTDASIKEIIDSGGKSSSPLTSDSRWTDQFAEVPAVVGSVFYAVPENIFGVIEYFVAKEGELAQYVTEDYTTIAKGYLKTLKSIGATTTQRDKTLVTNTHIRVVAIGETESKQVEEALERAFFKKLDQDRRSNNTVLGARSSLFGIFNLIRQNTFSPNN